MKFDFTFTRYGAASIEADTESEAWKIAEKMPADKIIWADDYQPTDAREPEEV